MKEDFKERVLRELNGEIDDIDLWRNETNAMMLRHAKEVFGESNGKIIQNKETWWFNEEIQQKTKLKKQQGRSEGIWRPGANMAFGAPPPPSPASNRICAPPKIM